MDFVQLRSGVYYYRRRLPRDLSRMLGQNELVRSIGRGDSDIALSRARAIDRAVGQALQKLHATPPLDQRTARSLFRSWVDHQLESEVPDHQKSSTSEPPAITATTERLGLHQMAERLALLLGIEMKSSSQGGLPSALGPLSLARSTPSSALLTLAQAIDKFKAEHGPSISPKTRVEYNQTLRLALEYWGPELPITAISKSEARDLKSLLVRLPANMAQKFPGKSLRHAVELAAKKLAPVINAKTINKKLSNLTTLFHWLKEQGYIEENPFTGLSVRDIAHRRRRDPFTPQQLSAIFSAQLCESNDGHQKRTKWQELENMSTPE